MRPRHYHRSRHRLAHMLTRNILIASLTLLAGALPSGAKVSLRSPAPDPVGMAFITVGITPIPTDPTPYRDASVWSVHIRTPANPDGWAVQVTRVVPLASFSASGQVQIYIALPPGAVAPLDIDTAKIDVALKRDGGPSVIWSRHKPEGQNRCSLSLNPSDNPAKADMYLSGSWVPAAGSRPSYNIDSHISVPYCLGKTWDLNVTGKVKTADHPNADPDSFSAGVALAPRFPFWGSPNEAFDFQWQAAQWEFSRRDEALNLTTIPTFTYARGWFDTGAAHRVTHSGGFNVRFAPALGENLRNHITAIRNGYGAIARMTPGADVYLALPRDAWSIRLTSTWDARILLTREPLIDYRRPVRFSLARGTRHSVSNTLEINPNKYFGISIKHEYGSLPPAFEFVDHKATVGLAITWSWH